MQISLSKRFSAFPFIVLFFVLVLSHTVQIDSQEILPLESPAKPKSADSPIPEPTPVPISNIVTRADSDAKKLQNIRTEITVRPTVLTIEKELPELSNAVGVRVLESEEILAARPSLETLSSIEGVWQSFSKDIAGWKDDLIAESDALNKKLEDLKNLKTLWQMTLASTTKITKTEPEENVADESASEKEQTDEVDIPLEVFEKIRSTINEIDKTETNIQAKRAALLSLQARVSEQENKIEDQLKSVKQAHTNALSNLFVKDHPSIWELAQRADAGNSIANGSQSSLTAQITALNKYSTTKSDKFLLHGFIFLIFLTALLLMRYRVTSWAKEDADLNATTTVAFELPVMTALIFTLLLSDVFYSQAPRLLWTILQSAALIPVIFILRRLLAKRMFPLLYIIAGGYFVNRVIEMIASLHFLTRILFLFEMVAVITFFVWFLWSVRQSEDQNVNSSSKCNSESRS